MSVHRSLLLREKSNLNHNFREKFLGSLYFAERYESPTVLEGHTGCVNSILFSECGSRIITGSDDMNINIYDLNGEIIDHMNTMHTNNVFFAKDLPVSSCNDIVSCAADGRVVLTNVVKSKHRQLFRHKGRAHRIALVPLCPTQFYSCGEDGICCLYDVRTSIKDSEPEGSHFYDTNNAEHPAVTLKTKFSKFTNGSTRSTSIYCLSVNAHRPYEVAMGGTSSKISIYDVRKFEAPMSHLCPVHLAEKTHHVTGLRFDYSGKNIIASYNDDDIYRMNCIDHATADQLDRVFDSTMPEERQNGYDLKYSGHRNRDTVKQVSFLGSHSEMVVSGSDCGNIFIWETSTGKLIKVLKADSKGAVNCLSSHPDLPILASSGLESNGKLWFPMGEHKPMTNGSAESIRVQELVDRNSRIRETGESSVSSRALLRWILSLTSEISYEETLVSDHSEQEEIMTLHATSAKLKEFTKSNEEEKENSGRAVRVGKK